jgi:signal transduction histidine kinase
MKPGQYMSRVEFNASGFRAFVIEDDPDARANLSDILELDGFSVSTAGSAEEALAFADWPKISIVILDRKLPDANALELLPRIRQLAPDAAVVIVTGYADLEGAIRALREGASDYILKPINSEALRASIARIIEHHRTAEALRQAQQRALQNERLAAIGETMAGLMHESRNALQRCRACLEMLTLEIADRPKALNLVERTQTAQNDLYQLFEEVREYAAPINLERKPCDVAEIWRHAWHDVASLNKEKNLHLAEGPDHTAGQCAVDTFKLRQVFRNVFENAVQVSPKGSQITVATEEIQIAGKPGLRVGIRDSGPGIPADVASHILEPFFTTKAKGTGLGLAIAQRIVQLHGGRIQIGHNQGSGAEILIDLPRGIP